MFTPSADTPAKALSLIRAKELVQASLAQVALRKGHEEAEHAAREASQKEEMMVGTGPSHRTPPSATRGLLVTSPGGDAHMGGDGGRLCWCQPLADPNR
jgi:hypothetical protein